ncbi:hypothetical protein CBS101457_004374 [Exobasidium rhododendri]|nr:hypothetical protein CBS101457_004374 [Exobasidium rhododendri]
MARKFDFRDPQGNHNVMVPSSSLGHKTFSLEAPDGQKLIWKREHTGWKLLSLPSQTLLAHYTIESGSSARYDRQGQVLLGQLNLFVMTESKAADPGFLNGKRRRASTTSTTSSSSSSEGPRLGRIHQRLAIGLCAPAVFCAAVASPHSAAGMNRFCTIGDELANLGKISITPVEETVHEPDAALEKTRDKWLSLNESGSNRKNGDPRPRNVEADLVISSLIAVLAG